MWSRTEKCGQASFVRLARPTPAPVPSTHFTYLKFLKLIVSSDTSVLVPSAVCNYKLKGTSPSVGRLPSLKSKSLPDGMSKITAQHRNHSPGLHLTEPQVIFDERFGLKLHSPAGQGSFSSLSAPSAPCITAGR